MRGAVPAQVVQQMLCYLQKGPWMLCRSVTLSSLDRLLPLWKFIANKHSRSGLTTVCSKKKAERTKRWER
eukprot:1422771-Amphidinium_carterae.1